VKKLLLLLSLGTWLFDIASAQTYFNKRKTLNSFAASVSSVINANDRYYTVSSCIDSINNLGGGLMIPIQGIRLTIWNIFGDILKDTVYQKTGLHLFPTSNSLIQLPNKNLICAVSAMDTSGTAKLEILCFDSLGNINWIKEYSKPYCTVIKLDADYWKLNDFKPDSFGNWILLSTYQCGVKFQWSYDQILLTKLDSNFNVIWHKSFGDLLNSSDGGHLIVESNRYIFAGCYSNHQRSPKGFKYQTEIFKTDTGGNQTWHWLSDSSRRTAGGLDLIHTKDGGYLFSGVGSGKEVLSGNGSTGFMYWRPWIEKIDSLGNTIWADSVTPVITNNGYNVLTRLAELPNSDVTASGCITSGFEASDSSNVTYGVLLKYAPDGKLKWRKKYTFNGDTMQYSVNDMRQTSDGGFIMGGSAYDYYHAVPAKAPWQRAWLLKVDSNGCSSNNDPQCWAVSVPHEPELSKGSYRIFPNPATNQLHVSFKKEHNADELFVLTDITGRRIAQSTLLGEAGNVYIDVQHLQTGIYLYRITEHGAVKLSGKITKQ
jgi:hypothetical protein